MPSIINVPSSDTYEKKNLLFKHVIGHFYILKNNLAKHYVSALGLLKSSI